VNRHLSHPVPWRLIAGITPYIASGRRRDLDDFTRQVVALMQPPPVFSGLDNLPDHPRFLIIANHYQRKGLWILHPAAAITQAVSKHYGPHPFPVRWMATANWPRLRFGPLSFPSPGDWLLPKVAHALSCYPVSFAGSNPAFTAQSIRQLLRDASSMDRPIGIFPEGVAGSAGRITEPLPGAGRLVVKLARRGLPAVPAAISESGGRLRIQFLHSVPAATLIAHPNPAQLCLDAIAAALAG
jgi:hypothetical protein